ncbi:hypothetical protein DFJ74DRAFT_318907 [Hyaloraphidium curvatum]|nr:hypothetical protein DFJ74DRAFT_318907 [Hyaloraphidium curvatum]
MVHGALLRRDFKQLPHPSDPLCVRSPVEIEMARGAKKKPSAKPSSPAPPAPPPPAAPPADPLAALVAQLPPAALADLVLASCADGKPITRRTRSTRCRPSARGASGRCPTRLRHLRVPPPPPPPPRDRILALRTCRYFRGFVKEGGALADAAFLKAGLKKGETDRFA